MTWNKIPVTWLCNTMCGLTVMCSADARWSVRHTVNSMGAYCFCAQSPNSLAVATSTLMYNRCFHFGHYLIFKHMIDYTSDHLWSCSPFCSDSPVITRNSVWSQQRHDIIFEERITHVAVICIEKNIGYIYEMCMAAERLKTGIPQQAAGTGTNQLAQQSSEAFDWLPGSPVVMMMGIRSCLCGLYPGTEVYWSKWYGWIGCRTFCPCHAHYAYLCT